MRTDARHTLGRSGEELAADHLRGLGFAVLARNVRTARGEIDMIARRGPLLVFAEVKTRRIGAAQRRPREDQLPLGGLGVRQRVRLRRLAAAWLAENRPAPPPPRTVRFDAIGVVLDTRGRVRAVEHIEGAW
ncbi:MAG TPA: YraN family protein [Solirubrobacteraceae bacterium]|jgi:putative endonuclease|nr:YraN family protein [Solirubrobacteraceae bacterium]